MAEESPEERIAQLYAEAARAAQIGDANRANDLRRQAHDLEMAAAAGTQARARPGDAERDGRSS